MRPLFNRTHATGYIAQCSPVRCYLYYVVRTVCRQWTIRTCSTVIWLIAVLTQSRSPSCYSPVCSSTVHRSSLIAAITKITSWISGMLQSSPTAAAHLHHSVVKRSCLLTAMDGHNVQASRL